MLLKAHVNVNGQVEVGDATATKVGVGDFTVDFGWPLNGCAFTGSVGAVGSGQFHNVGIVSLFYFENSTTLSVGIRSADTLVRVNSDFFVTGIC